MKKIQELCMDINTSRGTELVEKLIYCTLRKSKRKKQQQKSEPEQILHEMIAYPQTDRQTDSGILDAVSVLLTDLYYQLRLG